MNRMIERGAAHAALDAMTQNGDADTIERAKVLIDCLPPARFTREDVEKAAKAIAEHTYAVPDYADASDCREWDDMPDHVRDTYVKAATAALSAIGDVDHG
mgnify:FL=1